MICSYVKNNKFGFIEIHAEQVYTYISEISENSYKDNIPQIKDYSAPIHTDKLSISTLTKIDIFLRNQEKYPDFLFLDFQKISFVVKNLNEYFLSINKKLESNGSKLFIINFDDASIKSEDISFLLKFVINKNNSKKILNKDYSQLLNIKNTLKEERKEKKLKDNFKPQDPPYLHESSSVYLSNYFDFKGLILNDYFIYYALYELALKMIKKNEYHQWEINNKKVILLCQTLNSAFIGSILSDLLGLDIFLIDHLGPVNKIYNSFNGNIDKDKSYLVISDVVCLGTEVKNSKSIIEFSGAQYLGNTSFLRIESRKIKDINFNDIEFFYRIDENYNPVNYEIITALNKL